jgi:hypothetical protein
MDKDKAFLQPDSGLICLGMKDNIINHCTIGAMDYELDIVIGPEGFITPLFTWNSERTSHKLKLDEEKLTCVVVEGSGFKTVLGS